MADSPAQPRPEGTQMVAHLAACLAAACDSDPRNRLKDCGFRVWDTPLVGIAAASDPVFAQLKSQDVIGPHHLTPQEWLPGARSVVSYFLPATEEIRRANRAPGMVAPEWIGARSEGEGFNEALRDMLAGWLAGVGARAVVPCHTSRYQVVNRRSNWSERHAAYVAGLGTFGLSRSMITARGSAGRFGSAISDLDLPPTPRPYSGPFDYCPFLMSGGCGACIDRCPSGAIRPEGKDVPVCESYVHSVAGRVYCGRYGCGKCQTAVPCESRIPDPRMGPMRG